MNLEITPDSELKELVLAVCNAATTGTDLILYTSGTTGIPKAIRKNISNILSRRVGGSMSERWLLTYNPLRWAGISVILHVMRSDATLCVPKSLSFSDILEAGLRFQVTHISLTPSMFRGLLLSEHEAKIRDLPIRQVTFGGEPAVQSLLDLATRVWPEARLTHIYASTELGDICSVSDGLAGIPKHKLDKFQFSEQGELIVGDFRTGDIWELREHRYYFLGRAEEIINVGGNKVNPILVEEFAQRHGAVFARAFAIRSAMLGHVVGLQYVGDISERELLLKLRECLPKYACPVRIEKVNTIEVTDAGKVRRT